MRQNIRTACDCCGSGHAQRADCAARWCESSRAEHGRARC